MKVLSQNDELMVKDIARLGRLTQSQARMALEELVASGKVVVRKLRGPATLCIICVWEIRAKLGNLFILPGCYSNLTDGDALGDALRS
jgi:hypothetical protein